MTLVQETTIRRQRLPNGLEVVLEPMPWLRSASLALQLPAGAATDPQGREGSAAVLFDWLWRGAGERDARQLSDALDSLGLRRGGNAGRETTVISFSLLSSALPEALPLLADLVRRPRLDDDEFESARELCQQELASLEDNPSQRLFEALSRRFFTSPHGRSAYGSAEGLAELRPDEAREDFRRRYGPQGAVLAVAGGVSWEELLPLVERHFGGWQGESVPLPEVEVERPQRHHVEAETAQVQIGLAFEALPPDHEQWYRQSLAMSVLSGSSGSRLFMEVREKRGLVYSVHAGARALRGYGYAVGYAGTTPERAGETLEVMLAEIDRLRQGAAADELERARTGILSQLVMQGESSGARAGALASDMHLRGEPRSLAQVREAVEAVTLEQLNDFLAAQEPPRPTILTLGPGRPTAS